jgi:uncharacterized membrane protein
MKINKSFGMKKYRILFALFVVSTFIVTASISWIFRIQKTQINPQEFLLGKIVELKPTGKILNEGKEYNYTIDLANNPQNIGLTSYQYPRYGSDYRVGNDIILTKTTMENGSIEYFIVDHHRVPAVIFALGFFLVLVLLVAKKRGLASLLGLAYGIYFIIFALIPLIIAGFNPFVVSIFGIIISAIISLYLGHGLNTRTTLAVVSTTILLCFSAAMAWFFTIFGNISGFGTEDSLSLTFNRVLGQIDIRGLFLAGIMISVLGVLDDITTAQSAIVEELKRAKPELSFKELYLRAFSVGKEHIISLVNTLAYAYVGSSLVFILILSASDGRNLWTLINSEFISQEIIQTVVGSSSLVLAVPVTTGLAAWYYSRYGVGEKSPHDHHSHIHIH